MKCRIDSSSHSLFPCLSCVRVVLIVFVSTAWPILGGTTSYKASLLALKLSLNITKVNL